MPKLPSPQSGFTLIELLIVIVVIGILAAAGITSFSGVQERARNVQRQSDMEAIIGAVQLYKNDNNGAVPASINFGGMWPNYFDNNVPSDPLAGQRKCVSSKTGECNYYYTTALYWAGNDDCKPKAAIWMHIEGNKNNEQARICGWTVDYGLYLYLLN